MTRYAKAYIALILTTAHFPMPLLTHPSGVFPMPPVNPTSLARISRWLRVSLLPHTVAYPGSSTGFLGAKPIP